jgi:hypothetical protein
LTVHHKQTAFTINFPNSVEEIITDAKIGISSILRIKRRYYNCKALWDTGASSSVIAEKWINKLRLPPIGRTKVLGVTGIADAAIYLIDITLAEKIDFEKLRVTASPSLNNSGIDLLIGMDVIKMGDFSITLPLNSKDEKPLTFSFRVPSYEAIDYEKIVKSFNEGNTTVHVK